jgi:hypothetical protein
MRDPVDRPNEGGMPTKSKKRQEHHAPDRSYQDEKRKQESFLVDQVDDWLREYLEDSFSSLPEEFQPEVKRKPLGRKSQAE